MDDDDDEYDGDDDNDDFHIDEDRLLIGSFSALSRADFTLSKVHRLW